MLATSYISEYTKFMNDYLANNPDVSESQLRNRSILWDVTLDKEEQAGFDKAALPCKGYKYELDSE